MPWYDEAISGLQPGKPYSRGELLDCLCALNPCLQENSFYWIIGSMLKAGTFVRVGRDAYALPTGQELPIYTPGYSDEAKKLILTVEKAFSLVRFTVFETVLMNEFLNHLIAQNTIFLQVDKDISLYVFRFLQEAGYRDLLYKPSKKELDLYWAKDCIIVTDLVSEAPLLKPDPHSICIEKMLVDMFCDKLICGSYSKAEFSSIMEQAFGRYQIDRQKLLRYARRRNKETEILRTLPRTDK